MYEKDKLCACSYQGENRTYYTRNQMSEPFNTRDEIQRSSSVVCGDVTSGLHWSPSAAQASGIMLPVKLIPNRCSTIFFWLTLSDVTSYPLVVPATC